MTKFLALALSVATILGVARARASIMVIPGVRYQTLKSKDTTGVMSESDTQAIVGDGRVGIAFDNAGIYIGGLYRYEKSVSGDDEMTGTAYGASGGIVGRQFALIGTYIMNADRTYSTTSEWDLKGGTGYQIDVMYAAGITATFGIGPQLTYRNLKFEKVETNGTEADTKYTETSIDPGIVLWWRF